MLRAFHGDPQIRADALARLDQRHKSGELTPGALFLGENKATLAAALAHSSDDRVWEESLGLPRWLAYAIDYCLGSQPVDVAVAHVHQLLNAIEPGRDTEKQAGRVLADVLTAVAQELRQRGAALQPLLSACESLRDLHLQVLEGLSPPGGAWRTARKASIQGTNELVDPLDKTLGACVEAAAWDPVAAPTTVGDVLRLRGQVAEDHLARLFGWSAEDDQLTRKLLAHMFETYKKDHPEEQRDVFMLLREHHPAEEARLLSYMRFQNAERKRWSSAAVQQFMHSLGAGQ